VGSNTGKAASNSGKSQRLSGRSKRATKWIFWPRRIAYAGAKRKRIRVADKFFLKKHRELLAEVAGATGTER
jgi:hypothetical protein